MKRLAGSIHPATRLLSAERLIASNAPKGAQSMRQQERELHQKRKTGIVLSHLAVPVVAIADSATCKANRPHARFVAIVAPKKADSERVRHSGPQPWSVISI